MISLDSFGQGARSLTQHKLHLRKDADRSTEIEIVYTDLISLEDQKSLASAVKFGTKLQQKRKGRSQGRSRGSRSRDGSSGQKIAPRGLKARSSGSRAYRSRPTDLKYQIEIADRIDRSHILDRDQDQNNQIACDDFRTAITPPISKPNKIDIVPRPLRRAQASPTTGYTR